MTSHTEKQKPLIMFKSKQTNTLMPQWVFSGVLRHQGFTSVYHHIQKTYSIPLKFILAQSANNDFICLVFQTFTGYIKVDTLQWPTLNQITQSKTW